MEQQKRDQRRFSEIIYSYKEAYGTPDYYLKDAESRAWKAFELLPEGCRTDSLLDVGGMSGIFAPAYMDLWGYGKVAVLDMGVEGGEIVRIVGERRYPVQTASCNIELEPWPYPSESFDVVVCMEVIEHLIFDPFFAVNELCRILKPGGRLLLTVPNAVSNECLSFLVNQQQPGYLRRYLVQALSGGKRGINEIYNIGHFHEYTQKELYCLLNEAGFDVEVMDGYSYKPAIYNSWRYKALHGCVKLLFPRSDRICGSVLRALVKKRCYMSLDAHVNRFPEPLYQSRL